MSKVVTKFGTIDVPGGKEIIAENIPGFTDGEKIVAFKSDDFVDFQFSYPKDHTGVKHVPEGTVIQMHVLDAAIAQVSGKGKIVNKGK